MVSLENVGTSASTGISAVLSSNDPLVTITTATASYPDIAAGGIAACIEPFVVELPGNVPEGHELEFTRRATDLPLAPAPSAPGDPCLNWIPAY